MTATWTHPTRTPPAEGREEASPRRTRRAGRLAQLAGVLALAGGAVLVPATAASAAGGVPLMYDIDADGVIDPSAVDADLDGWLDHNLVDLDGNGVGDTWLVDNTQDSLVEEVQVDTDGDTWVDLWLVDADQNGVVEQTYVDADGDRLPDGAGLVIESLPQPTVEIDWAGVCAADPFWCGQWPQVSSNGTVVSSPYLGGPSIGAGLESLGNATGIFI